MGDTQSTPVAVALPPTHVWSCTRLTKTERASACLFTDTWDCTWRNRPCAKLPPPPPPKNPPPPPPQNTPHPTFKPPPPPPPKIPPKSDSTALRPTSQ